MSTSLDQFRSEYDEESLGMLSDILSTLYQNPERSVLREYIANGIDAHKISGYDGPVEVTLPTHQRPTLVIRDHGNGLSRADMQRVYFSYVRSTKRDDDNQIGALGLGAKSAFALTKSWTVTNIHDKLKYVVASVNDDYGAPQQTVLVNGVPTDEHSGITVTIPVSERHLAHRWLETAHSLALWLPKGSVSINGAKAERHWTADTTVYGNTVRAKTGVYASREFTVFQAIMGGIGYVVDDMTKETVRQEAERILAESDYDTAAVRDAVRKHPKAALSQDKMYRGSSSTPYSAPSAEDVEKDTARMGHAHDSLRSALLSSVMGRPIKVDLGDVDFMPSRESVKGTPRTISALAQAIAVTVEKMSAEVVAARSKRPEERVPAIIKLSNATGVNNREALTAAGVHDTDTDIYTIGVGGTRLGAHNVILSSAGRVLVTGIEGTSLYKGKMYARAKRVSVYVTRSASLTDKHIGDISRYFRDASGNSQVMSHDKFKAIVAEEFPAQRGGVDTRHQVWVSDGHGAVDHDQIAFSDLEDHLDGLSKVYVSDEAPYGARLKEASLFGMQIAVVVRGRRKPETFAKMLGEDVVSSYERMAVDVSKHVSKEALRIVSAADRNELRALALATSERAKRVTAELEVLFDSAAGELVPSDHRARSFTADFSAGISLMATTHGCILNRSMLLVDSMADNGDKAAVAARVPVDTDPWPLLTGTSRSASSRTMTHTAMYLAAVG